MPVIKEQKLLKSIQNNKYIKAFKVISTSDNFEKRFEGSVSLFFRTLKNSLISFQGVSNREYFKNISGCYFSLEESPKFEIIILYDSVKNDLDPVQVQGRIKKLLGNDTKVEFGDYQGYKDDIINMVGIVRKTQTFGDFYFNQSKAAD